MACATHSKRGQCHRLLSMDAVSPNAASPSFPVACTRRRKKKITTHSKCCPCHRLLLMDPVSPNAASPPFWVECTQRWSFLSCWWTTPLDVSWASIAYLELMLSCVHLMVNNIAAQEYAMNSADHVTITGPSCDEGMGNRAACSSHGIYKPPPGLC